MEIRVRLPLHASEMWVITRPAYTAGLIKIKANLLCQTCDQKTQLKHFLWGHVVTVNKNQQVKRNHPCPRWAVCHLWVVLMDLLLEMSVLSSGLSALWNSFRLKWRRQSERETPGKRVKEKYLRVSLPHTTLCVCVWVCFDQWARRTCSQPC